MDIEIPPELREWFNSHTFTTGAPGPTEPPYLRWPDGRPVMRDEIEEWAAR